MTQSSILLDLFKRLGLTHDVNHFIPQHTEIKLQPWTVWNGLCRVPYSWEDDVHILYSKETSSVKSPKEIFCSKDCGLKVFDYHPIHIFLNTENLERYEKTRALHQKTSKLIECRHEGHGTRNLLIELLEFANTNIKHTTTSIEN